MFQPQRMIGVTPLTVKLAPAEYVLAMRAPASDWLAELLARSQYIRRLLPSFITTVFEPLIATVGLTQASSVMPVVKSSDALSGIVTKFVLVPLNCRKLPNLARSAVVLTTRVVPVRVP